MKKVLAIAVLLIASPVMADFYVAGSFGSDGDPTWWNPGNPDFIMNDMGSYYSLDITGQPGVREFKVTQGNWTDPQWPGDGGNIKLDWGAGDQTVNFFDGVQGDGWMPEANRVGFSDPGLHGWEAMGPWTGGDWLPLTLDPMGGGLYSGQIMLDAGDYTFKFRKAGDWEFGLGFDFRNYGGDINFNVAADSMIQFDLDLPNGRWRTSVVPEPTALAMLAIGGLALIRRR